MLKLCKETVDKTKGKEMWTSFALPKTFFLLLHHHHRPNNPSSRDHRVWCPLSSPLSKLDLINLWEPQRRRRRLPEAREKRGGGLVSKKHRKKRTGEKFFFRLNFFSGSLFPLLDSSRARCLRCLLQLSRRRKHLFALGGKASVRKYVFQTKYFFPQPQKCGCMDGFFPFRRRPFLDLSLFPPSVRSNDAISFPILAGDDTIFLFPFSEEKKKTVFHTSPLHPRRRREIAALNHSLSTLIFFPSTLRSGSRRRRITRDKK